MSICTVYISTCFNLLASYSHLTTACISDNSITFSEDTTAIQVWDFKIAAERMFNVKLDTTLDEGKLTLTVSEGGMLTESIVDFMYGVDKDTSNK